MFNVKKKQTGSRKHGDDQTALTNKDSVMTAQPNWSDLSEPPAPAAILKSIEAEARSTIYYVGSDDSSFARAARKAGLAVRAIR